MCADKINDCDASASPTNTFGNITVEKLSLSPSSNQVQTQSLDL